ncbi:MAG: PhzF family phenazine biosynthesis protein [Rhizomicrobium sp.]
MALLRIAAFCDGSAGGNPAGVSIGDVLPPEETMRRIAAEVGFSETAFAAPAGDSWRVRYFSPQSEVPFCGHATIALGAALALQGGDGIFKLELNNAKISVEGRKKDDVVVAALQSPPTRSKPASHSLTNAALDLFGYAPGDLDDDIPPAEIHAGADHLVLTLRDRKKLAAMQYDLEKGRLLMKSAGLVTIALIHVKDQQSFDARNAFASGGVLEDPATGAAAAAFSGYLRDIRWPHGGRIHIVQGEDMGMRSIIHADISPTQGSSIRVSGTARIMAAPIRVDRI